MIIELHAQPPFSLDSVIHSHGWARLAPFGTFEGETEISYVYKLNHQQVVKLNISDLPDGVSVDVQGEIPHRSIETIKSDVAWMRALDQSFEEFYRLSKREPRLTQVQDKAQGRLLRSPTLFENAVKTILTTNTSWSGTIRMTESLVTQFGDPLPGSDVEFSFASPERIASSSEQILRNETRLGYRAPYILALSRQVESGALDLEGLKTSKFPGEDLHRQLTSIKDIGDYAAANLMMLLGRYEYLPIDSWALKMVSQEYYNGNPISAKEVKEIFDTWGKWKGLAYWLWNGTEE